MIQLLDCSLRDGAHVNAGNFGFENIIDIAENLSQASLDYVELGFLKNVVYNPAVTFYPHIEKAYKLLAHLKNVDKVKYALMARADEYDIKNLSECNGKIEVIRVAFYYDFLEKAVNFAREVIARGYLVTLNLINTPGSSLDELDEVIKFANKINPYTVTIVDTFGSMFIEDMNIISEKYNQKLNPNIKLGLHVHENRALAFPLAQEFIKNIAEKRDVIVDGSLLGIGRIPGNLPTELIADYLNVCHKKNYGISYILKALSDNIVPIKNKINWGYSPAYFLSASYKVHRSYAEYLLKKDIPLDKMHTILKKIDNKHSGKFYKDYIDELLSLPLEDGGEGL